MKGVSPIYRRLLAEDLSRLRRADERLRFSSSQRWGRIDPNPHQIDAVVFALKRIPEGGCILADEVGLGKTVEAGLVIAQLLAEGKQRILLIVPKSLVGQWQTELYTLFGIQTREGRADPEAFAGNGVFIVHREFAGGLRGAPLLSSSDPFDLAIIDEAHEIFAGIYKRYDKQGLYKSDSSEAQIADRVRSFLRPTGTPVLLLTATPIQNSLVELWGLVQYVEPTDQLLGRLSTFRSVFCEGGDRGVNPEQSFELRRRLSSVLQRTLRRQAQEFLEIPFVERQTKLIEYSMDPDQQKLYDDVTSWLMDPYSCAFGGRNRRLLLIGFHRRLGSSMAALRGSLNQVAQRLRQRLQDSVTSQKSASTDDLDGFVSDFKHEFDEDWEELLEDDVESPTYAIESDTSDEPSPERLRAELQLMEDFIARADSTPKDSKSQCLLDVLKVIRERENQGTGSGKVVIFTESIRTQDFLVEFLTQNGFADDEVTLFRGVNDHRRAREALQHWTREFEQSQSHGDQPSRSVAIRLALVQEFRERSHVFISTEAGAKGLNLQFCETLINYDLPWNPQRIEQRIGRIHRYGQRRGVTVLNFLDRGNEAQRLTFEILSQKLDLFGKVLDASDMVLHEPSSEFPEPLIAGLGVEFEAQLRKIYQQSRSIDEVTERLRELRRAMESKRRDFEQEQARAAELVSSRLDDSVRHVFRRWQSELPAGLEELDRDLDQLLSGYLTAIGTGFERRESASHVQYQIEGCDALPIGYQSGTEVFIGPQRGKTSGEPFHPGHRLFTAAVAESRQATSHPLHVVWKINVGSTDLPHSLQGRRGRLAATKVSYRGFEPVDHILVTAMLEGEFEALPVDIVEKLLSQEPMGGLSTAATIEVDSIAFLDAIAEAVMDDQVTTTAEEENRFIHKLEQLDRYLDDQALVLRGQQSSVQKKLDDEMQKRLRTNSPAAITRANRTIESLRNETQRLEKRIEQLQQGQDADFQQWRSRLFERRYRRPDVERLFEATFEVLATGDAKC